METSGARIDGAGVEPSTSAVRFRRTGTPIRALDPSPRWACRPGPRSSSKTLLAPSSRDRPERDQRPSEKPCPLTVLPAADLSAVALARLHSHRRRAEARWSCEQAGEKTERHGDYPRRDMSHVPEVKARRRFLLPWPLLRETWTPRVVSRKPRAPRTPGARTARWSARQLSQGPRPCATTAPAKETHATSGQGAWNPT